MLATLQATAATEIVQMHRHHRYQSMLPNSKVTADILGAADRQSDSARERHQRPKATAAPT